MTTLALLVSASLFAQQAAPVPTGARPVRPIEQLLFDSGNPMVHQDSEDPDYHFIQFIDTWHVIDVLDDLGPQFVAPIAFDYPVEITRFEFYLHTPRLYGTKRLDLYTGTSENTVGTHAYRFDFVNHPRGGTGWQSFTLPTPVAVPSGMIGVSIHSEMEFNVYWAPDAEHGAAYAWGRRTHDYAWDRIDVQPGSALSGSMTIRVYGRPAASPGRSSAVGQTAGRPVRPTGPVSVTVDCGNQPAVMEAAPMVYRYQGDPSDREMIHVVRQPVVGSPPSTARTAATSDVAPTNP